MSKFIALKKSQVEKINLEGCFEESCSYQSSVDFDLFWKQSVTEATQFVLGVV